MAGSNLVVHSMADVTVVNFSDTAVLDTVQIEALGESLFALVDKQACRKIVLDFEKVKFLSSSALSVLIQMQKKARDIKGRVVLCGMRPELKRIFEITNLHKLFEFFPGERDALASFGVTGGG